MADGVVIVGGGQAGSQLAASLREHGYAEPIRLVAAEDVLPYQRPPLSKTYIKDEFARDRLFFRNDAFYAQHKIDVMLGAGAARIDRRSRKLELANGTSLAYAHLVLATGSHNRPLPVPGADLDGIFYLRSLAEADRIREYMERASSVAVIGAGFVGLELACVMRATGKSVAVVEAAERPLMRVLSMSAATHLAEQHAASGIALHVNAKVTAFTGQNGRVSGVSIAGQSPVAADMVLIGIGAVPAAELAADSGLAVSNGIEVNEFLTTSDESVHAIGDCASFVSKRYGSRVRLESVQNAVDHARALGATLAGQRTAYDDVPWFWSDQGEQRLQMAGLTTGYDRAVIRGTPASGRFSVFCYAGDRLLGVESINQPADHMSARRVLKAGAPLPAAQAADLSFDLKAFAQAAR